MKKILKTLLVALSIVVAFFFVGVYSIFDDVRDSFTKTKGYAFDTVSSCVDWGFDVDDCSKREEAAKALWQQSEWQFKDAGQCALFYGAENCVRENKNAQWKAQRTGFAWVEGDIVFPVYERRNGSLIAANSYPIQYGEFTVEGGTEYLPNLTKNLPLYSPVCSDRRFKRMKMDTAKYYRNTLLDKIDDEVYFDFRIKERMLEVDYSSCRIILGLIEGEIE